MSAAELDSPLPTLESFSSAFTKLEDALQPLAGQPLKALQDKLQAGSSHAEDIQANPCEGRLDVARLNVSIAYVLLDLFWMHLKLTGQDTVSHPVTKELERVKVYFGKIKQVQAGQDFGSSASRASGPTLPGQEGRPRVDAAAAGRFIDAAIKGKHTKFIDDKALSSATSEDKDTVEASGARHQEHHGADTVKRKGTADGVDVDSHRRSKANKSSKRRKR